MNSGNKNQSKKKPVLTIAVMFGGIAASVNPRQLDWKTYHGTAADGTEVKSLAAAEVKDDAGTVVIKKPNGKWTTYRGNELEVFAAQFLKDKGYAITAPSAGGLGTSS